MKRILHSLVTVVTVFCVLAVSIIPAFATGSDRVEYVNHQGYTYYLDEEGVESYDYPIELYDEIITYDVLNSISFYTAVDGTSALDLSYIVEEVAPNLSIVEGSGAALGGAAVASGGGTVAGTVATICGMTTGQIVLFATLVASGIVLLTEPELVSTTLNDIWFLLETDIQQQLGHVYTQETWLIDEDLAAAINEAISKVSYISDGVIWNMSLSINTDCLTGLATELPVTNVVVENQPASALTVEYFQLQQDVWTAIDNSATILYKCGPEGIWSDGVQYGPSDQSVSNKVNLEVLNTSSGVSVSFFPSDAANYPVDFTYSTEYYRKWFIAEPVLVTDGQQMALEIVFGRKKNTSTFYEFWGQVSWQKMLGEAHPIIMDGTGTILDGNLIVDLSYNADSSKWTYTYREPGAGNDTLYTVEYPLEPFHWCFSQSMADTNTASAGALNTTETTTGTDEYGKIETITVPEIPEVEPIEIPKLESETATETDPETGEEVDKETVIYPDGEAGTGSDPGTGVDPEAGLDPIDPENPDHTKIKGWLLGVFQLNHLFDWLPEQYSFYFDLVILFIGSAIVSMLLYSIGKLIF